MLNETVRKTLLYVGIALLVMGAAMLVFAGGSMIVMDAPLLIVGGALTLWALIERRRAAIA